MKNLKANVTMVNTWYFIQGYVRLFIYKYVPFLMRKHIKKTYEERLVKAKKCLDNGSCYACGCTTPALFFADKGCAVEKYDKETRKIIGVEKPCYPKMPTKKEYENVRKTIN